MCPHLEITLSLEAMVTLQRGARVLAFSTAATPFTLLQTRSFDASTASSVRYATINRTWSSGAGVTLRGHGSSILRFKKVPKGTGGFGGGNGASGGGYGGGFGNGSYGGGGGGDDRGPVARLVALYVDAVTRRPILTKATSTLLIGSAGDYLAQRISASQSGEEFQHDVRRTAAVGTWGFFFMGPVLHYWYGVLDRIFFGRYAAVRKMVTDQLCFAAFFNGAFVVGVGMLEGSSFENSTDRMWNTIWPSMKANWSIWPIAQMLNFTIIPKTYQILYVNCVGLLWNCILSYIAHSNGKLAITAE